MKENVVICLFSKLIIRLQEERKINSFQQQLINRSTSQWITTKHMDRSRRPWGDDRGWENRWRRRRKKGRSTARAARWTQSYRFRGGRRGRRGAAKRVADSGVQGGEGSRTRCCGYGGGVRETGEERSVLLPPSVSREKGWGMKTTERKRLGGLKCMFITPQYSCENLIWLTEGEGVFRTNNYWGNFFQNIILIYWTIE